jgi:hypothetical protein
VVKLDKMASDSDGILDQFFSEPLQFGLWSIDDERWLHMFREKFEGFDISGIVKASIHHTGQNEVVVDDSQSTTVHQRKYSRSRQIIPRVIHHIWLGSELPQHFCKLRQV